MNQFELEFETRIRQLKSEFLAWRRAAQQAAQHGNAQTGARERSLHLSHAGHVAELRAMVQANLHRFDARRASSLLALPSRTLDYEERILHRIWMGSALPQVAREAMLQWNAALLEAGAEDGYRQMLWVWDEAQVKGDACFARNVSMSAGGIGRYTVGSAELEVYSLRSLVHEFLAPLSPLIEALQAKRYFVNLSDLFRLVILREFGGIYLDVDTLPYRSAPVFLAKPEVPDYHEPGAAHVSWMNLYRDENGALVAARNDAAVAGMVRQIADNLARLPRKMHEVHELPLMRSSSAEARAYAALLQDATYGVWVAQMGRSFLAYCDISERHCVLHDGQCEAVPAGLEGMRLVTDALTNEPVPLSERERRNFERCVHGLDARDWRLGDALELEALGEVFCLDEHPRMAYPPQLRSRIANCAYYSFLSHDERLDRVNTLFGAYLIKKNAQRIAGAGFWRPTGNQSKGEFPAAPQAARGDPRMITFLPGTAMDEVCRDRMAKLLFATSYLEYCSFGNKLNLSFVELQRRQNIDPYIALLRGMVDGDGNFIGFFTAGSLAEFDKVQAVSYYRDDMRAMDAAYDGFIASHARTGDLFVSSLAIDEQLRGQGMFNAMWHEIELTARSKGCTRIVLTVWENKSDAFAIYLKKGFRQEGIFEYARELFFDRLHFLSYELEPVPAHEEHY